MPSYVNFFRSCQQWQNKCKRCEFIAKYESSHQHTTNLRFHLTAKHPEQLTPEQKAKVHKNQDYFTTGQSSLPIYLPQILKLLQSAVQNTCFPLILSKIQFFNGPTTVK